MRRPSYYLLAALASSALLASPAGAWAGNLELKISTDGGSSFDLLDPVLFQSSPLALGSGGVSGASLHADLLGFSIDITGSDNGQLDINVFGMAAADYNLVIRASVNDIQPGAGWKLVYHLSAPQTGPQMMDVWFDPGNTLFATTHQLTPAGGAGISDYPSSSYPFSVSAPFSMTSELRFAGLADDFVMLDGAAALSAVPVPGGMVLVLTGVPLLGLLRRARRELASEPASTPV